MRVSPITKNHLSFGKVGFSEEQDKFTSSELDTAKSIIAKMQTPSDDFNGKTAEKHYENLGYDFGIYTGKQRNTVDVVGWQKYDKGYSEFFVGRFDDEHKFDLSDIETGIKNNEQAYKDEVKWNYDFAKQILFGMVSIYSLMGLSMLAIVDKDAKDNAKNTPVEVVDKSTPEVQTAEPDTIQFTEAEK